MSEKEKQRAPWVLFGTVAACSLALGFAVDRQFFTQSTDPSSSEVCAQKYPLLRSDLDCTSVNDDYARVTSIQDDLDTYIEQQKTDGNIRRVSVFFRDLSSRRWAAANKDEQYAPGSMLKVVLAIAYYKLAEIEPQILSQEYTYSPTQKSMNDMETFKPNDKLVTGNKYSVETLIGHMIKDSDNDAATLLGDSIDMVFLNKVFSDLNIHLPKQGGSEQNFITAERMSSVIRSLYQASYLDADNSQKLLTLMSQTSFSEGIVAGVASSTPVAHKFGEREVIDAKSQKKVSAELHDCGIVYKGTHPYILCVMTEGSSYDTQTKVLSGISRLVFDNE